MRRTDSGCYIVEGEGKHDIAFLRTLLSAAVATNAVGNGDYSVGVDVETRPRDPSRREPDMQRDFLVGVGVSLYRGDEVAATYYGLATPEYLSALRPLEHLPWYAANALFDATILRRYGIRLGELRGDPRMIAYLLGEPEAKLKSLLTIYMPEVAPRLITFQQLLEKYDAKNISEVPLEAQADYCGSQDAELCVVLARRLEARLTERALGIYRSVELPLVNVLVDMSVAGIRFDREAAAPRLEAATTTKDGLDRGIRAVVEATGFKQVEMKDGQPYLRRCEGCHGGSKRRLTCDRCDTTGKERTARPVDFNPGSATQLRSWLYHHMDFPVRRWTDTGDPSTDALALLQLKHLHPVIKLLFRRRKAAKQEAFLKSWLKTSEEDGRIHSTLTNTTVASGRLSSRDPNLQQVTLDFRDLFVA